ncbi:MAG: hypothetical protein IPL19_02945 [Sandaracinaceae bacterium]|jgi:hypothetical protein|nr:hypothetical protein [Sandaracinaceae bacterium]
MSGAPPARALWCLNLDAEDELRTGAGYTPSRATLAAVATAREAALALLGPEDALLGEEPVMPCEGDELRRGVAWCPTPSALARLAAAGAQVPVAPGLATLREVNASRFTYDVLGPRLPDAQVLSSLDAAETWLAARSPSEPVWLKRAFGAAGRGKLRAHGGALAPHTRAFLSPAELSLGVVLEPHVDITIEVSQHALLAPSGSLVVGAPCVQQVDRGRFVSVRPALPRELDPREAESLGATVHRLAAALHRAGYFGPLGVDAYRYVDAHGLTRWNPCGELNARYTMGYAVGMRGAASW